MRAQRVVQMLVMVLIIGTIILLGFGQAVLHLWNWLMPATFTIAPSGARLPFRPTTPPVAVIGLSALRTTS